MKLPPHTTTIAAVLVIGTLGFVIGRISSPGSPDGTSAPENRIDSVRTSSARGSDAGGHASAATAKRGARPDGTRASAATQEEKLKRLEAIIRGENPLDRSRALLAYIDQLGPGDFEAAIAHFRGLGITESRFGEYAMLLTAWAQADPMAALTYAKANTRSGFATNTILASWAATDPDAAIRWAEANHTGTEANPYFASIIRTLGATDPAKATSLLTGMERSPERGEALDALLPHIVAQGGDAARTWISNLTDESLRNGSMMRAAEQLAQTDPKATADWLLANPGDATKRTLDNVLGVWASNNQAAALAYFEALPRGEDRSNALRGVISAVASQDAAAAAKMLDRYTGDVTDSAIQSFVWHSFGSDPALALSYIGRLSDQGSQERMYSRTLDNWLNHDATAAQAWLQKNSLSANVQRYLQGKAAQGQQ